MTAKIEWNSDYTKMTFSDGRKFVAVDRPGCTGCFFHSSVAGCTFHEKHAQNGGSVINSRCALSSRSGIDRRSIVWVLDDLPEEVQEPETSIDQHYDRIDRFLRNNLGDEDYRVYSESLEAIYHGGRNGRQD